MCSSCQIFKKLEKMKHENDSHLCQHNPDILYRKICNQIEAIVFEILAKSTGLEVESVSMFCI